MYGKFRHETIDNGMYSTKACVISGKPVWSEELGIGGKIDIYDTQEQHLIERKAKLHRLHLGHLMQVYAQTAALREMGYPVSRISIHSLDDNKRYAIPLPTEYDMQRLADVVTQIRSTHTKDLLDTHVDAHGTQSIYGGLAW
jgi:CRISPR-associated protein Cas4